MNNKLNTPPLLKTTGAVHLNEEIEETRGYDHHSPDGIYAGNNSCVASNTSILVNQHYSPPDHFVQQDFIAAYNQILQQQQQQQNLSFMQYTTKNFSYLDTIQQQQQYQQHSEQKRNMRHCLSSSDTSRYMDVNLDGSCQRMPPSSSSSYSLNNYYCDDSYDLSAVAAARDDLTFSNNHFVEQQFVRNQQQQQRPLKQSYNHMQPSVSSSAISNYNRNAPSSTSSSSSLSEDSCVSSKKKKLTNYSISASSIDPQYHQNLYQQQQQQHQFNRQQRVDPQQQSIDQSSSSSNLMSSDSSAFGFSSSYSSVNSSFYGQNYIQPASDQKQSNFLQNKHMIKSLSGTQILPSGPEKLNSSSLSSLNKLFQNRINDYVLKGGDTAYCFDQTNQRNGNGNGSSIYYSELSNNLDVSNSCHESDTNTYLKSSQSNYSLSNNSKSSNPSFKNRITKSSTTCFNKENVNSFTNSTGQGYQNNNAATGGSYYAHSTSYDNMRALKNTSLIKDRDHNSVSSFATNSSANPNGQQYLHVTPTNLNSSVNNKSSCSSTSSSSSSDQIVLHVRNLDYKISADEWKRILLENFRKHCKEIISVNVITNVDKSLLGIVKLATKEDARLAISCLHHKKIGYKRLNVTIAFSANNNSPKSKIVALLKNNESTEMALTKFMELYEQRYNQSITVSELFKLKDVVYISPSKDGQGRHIKLTARNHQNNLENEMHDLLQTPYCSLHSHKQDMSLMKTDSVGWLPNVIVSLRAFKSAVHKLLNDHGGQMPLLSFMDCYKCCIFNDSNNNSISVNSLTTPANFNSITSSVNRATSMYGKDLSYQLVIDNENGVSLEHLITCAQDVQIQLNEGFYKQLQWENDKSKPHTLQSRSSFNKQRTTSASSLDLNSLADQFDQYEASLDETLEDSQKKLNQFGHEVVELFKGVPKCIIPMSRFNNEYHKKYGRQCRVADYGFTKLYELLEAIPHILQILDSEYEKKLTLTHRIQVRRFSNDLIKVLKTYSSKMFADDYPLTYEKHFGRPFDIKDYGVCYLEDMLAELPDSIVCRKEIEGRTFIQIPKIVQMDEERLCTTRLVFDIVDMLKHKPRFSIQFNKFIPNFHHHFGRQCKLSNYGFTKLIELMEAIPETVQVLVKDGLQFVQLKSHLMLDLICLNIVKYLEDNNQKVKISLSKLEELYNTKYEAIHYQDFGCENFVQLFSRLPFKSNFICVKPAMSKVEQELDLIEWYIEVEALNEKSAKRAARLMLKKLMDDSEEFLSSLINEKEKNCKLKSKQCVTFSDLFEMLVDNNPEFSILGQSFNKRSINFISKCLTDYFIYSNVNVSESDLQIIGFSDIYWFAKQIRNIFKSSNLIDMTMPELETFYKKMYVAKNSLTKSVSINEQLVLQQQQLAQPVSVLPFRRLGFIDAQLLFTQGLNLLVTIKKFTDKRICLNKEFWPKSIIETTSPVFCDSLNSSFITESDSNSGGSANGNNNSSEKSMTPLSHRISGSSSETFNSSRRILFSNTGNENNK